ncbi:related to hypercellular protein (hypa) [Pseudozyma flocculosa]|nr:related to hypercellular protein (hypa) [Pseudozyma flocculosa]
MDHASPTPNPIGGGSFVDAAKIRILLTPVGDVSPADFARWSQHVRNFDIVRLKHLPGAAARKWPAHDSPLRQVGEVHLSFVTSTDPSHSFLAPFNLNRQVLGVLGLSTFGPGSDTDALERTPGALRELHPGAIVHRVFGFDNGATRPQTMDLSSVQDVTAKIEAAGASTPGAADDSRLPPQAAGEARGGMPRSVSANSIASEVSSEGGFSGRNAGGLVIFPAVRKDAKDVNFYLRTLVAELVASILDGLDGIVSALEGTPLETPRETLDGIVSPTRSSASSALQAVTSPTASSFGTAASTAASRASALFSSFGGGGSGSGSPTTSVGASSMGTGGGTITPSSSSTASRPVSAIGGGSQPDMGLPTTPSSLNDAKRRTILSPVSTGKKGRKTSSAGGVGPTGTGRFAKVRADFHLLAGDLWTALEGYEASLNFLGKERALAGGQDAVWYASALEGWAVAKVLVSRMGGEVLEKAPAFDLPAGVAAAASANSGKDKDRDKDKDARDAAPYAKQAWGEIAEAYSLALAIYSKCLAPPHVLLEPARSVTNETPRDFTHPLIHAGACIQYSRFLLAVWASAGWNGECFDQLLYGGVPPALAEETRPSQGTFTRMSALSGVQRHDIASAASSALTQSVAALKATDQITVLCTLTSLFGCIGFSRREAYLLRQLQAVIVSLLAKSMLQRSRQPTTTTLPLLCDAADDELLGTIVSQVSHETLRSGPEAILVLAMQVCETHGVHVEVDPLKNVPAYHILSRAGEGLRSAYTSPNPGSARMDGASSDLWGAAAARGAAQLGSTSGTDATPSRLELESEARFGWPEQQVALLKDTIAVAEMLGDNIGMAFFAAILLRDYHALLSPDEQWRVHDGLVRVTASARWQGAQDLQVRYWGPAEPLCSLQFVPLQGHRLPTERALKDLDASPSSADGAAAQEGVAGLDNPFFWNPATGASRTGGKDSVMAVAGEPLEVMATLQNPFAFDLEVETIRLVTEGVGFEAAPTRTVMPAGAFHTIRLSGTAEASGMLRIKGIALALAGCSEETFLLPIYDEQSERERQQRAAEAVDKRTRIKNVGLDARPAVVKHRETLAAAKAEAEGGDKAKRRTASNRPQAEPRYLECRVAPPQPLLRVECAALRYGTLHLFEGERKTLRLRITNTSSEVAVDYVKLSFSDNLSETAKQVLLEGDLLPSDAHELEWDLLHRPVLQVRSRPSSSSSSSSVSRSPPPQPGSRQHRLHIPPGQAATLDVDVLGKLDCSAGRITVEYASLAGLEIGASAKQPGLGDKFYTRSLTLPLNITVQPLLECGPIEVRPLRASEAAKLTAQSLALAEPGASVPAGSGSGSGRSLDTAVAGPEAGADLENAVRESKQVDASVAADPDGFCLLSMDVRNVFSEAVAVKFALNTGGLKKLDVERTLAPQTTSRFVFPFPRLWLASATTRQAIPTLSRRQFIVSKLVLSPRDERQARRRFWYRQELLGRFRAEWTVLPRASASWGAVEEAGRRGKRVGEIGLRDQVLSDVDVAALQREGVKVECAFLPAATPGQPGSPNGDDAGRQEDKTKTRTGRRPEEVMVQRETTVTIRATVHNQSDRPLKLLIRFVAVPSSSSCSLESKVEREREDAILSSCIIWTNGNANQRITPWPLAPPRPVAATATASAEERAKEDEQGVATVEKEVMFLSSGLFSFLVGVEEVVDRPASTAAAAAAGRGGGEEEGQEEEKVVYVSGLPLQVVVV